MRVLIIGTGSMGRGIATRLIAGGNDVTLFDKSPDAARTLAAQLQGAVPGTNVAVAAGAADAVRESHVVILATPYDGTLEIARELRKALDDKVVVDISNPLNATFDALVTSPSTSAAETIRAVLPSGAKLVKAFNTTFAGTLVAGEVAVMPLDVLIAGDDDGAKSKVADLVRGGGMIPIDVGALERARQLEALGLLGITLQGRLGTGFMSGWKLVMPKGS
ncbi:MAG TPA: NADPH-dependent F420 reductase [Gemmatimonadaceae bacterium]|nr:NADPH-dependent F420 reductase [Gemmatimonadaceae bacterium]